MSVVVSLPRRVGCQVPKHVFRRVRYQRAVPAEVVQLPIDLKARAYNLYLAGCAVDEQDSDAGIALYEQAIQADPTYSLSYTNLGNCFYRKGRVGLARLNYQRAIQLDPNQPEALYNLGFLTMEDGDIEGAIKLFLESLQQDPSFADAWFNLGLAREKQAGTHRTPAVRRCFVQFLKHAPADDRYIPDARRRLA